MLINQSIQYLFNYKVTRWKQDTTHRIHSCDGCGYRIPEPEYRLILHVDVGCDKYLCSTCQNFFHEQISALLIN